MNQETLPYTAPDSIPVSIQGFDTEANATSFAHTIVDIIREISRHINLKRLDGITVAYDYDDALAGLDRGFNSTQTLERTISEEMIGIAMAPLVKRNGVVKVHLVFHASFVRTLEETNTDDFQQSLSIVAHECAHIEEYTHWDECFPGVLLAERITDPEKSLLLQISGALWDEYAACRISATFADNIDRYSQVFVDSVSVAEGRRHAAIRNYRTHGDVGRVLEEAGKAIFEPMKAASYLLGTLDGLGVRIADISEANRWFVGGFYASLLERQSEILRLIWDERNTWQSRKVFDPLERLVRDTFKTGGLQFTRTSNGDFYVNIPFTPETMP